MKTSLQRIRQLFPTNGCSDRVLIGSAFTIVLTLSACGSNRDPQAQNDLREESKAVLGKPSSAVSNAGAESASSSWAIVLESYPGDTSASQSERRAREIGSQIGRNDVGVRSTNSGSAVVMGRYTGMDDPRAKEDLEWVRSLQTGGRRIFERVFIAPPKTIVDPGSVPELSLQMARATFGSRARYTLQIGVYELPDRDRAKRAAEEAALALRQDGTLAFYHHGPRRSMVTVGVFNDDDLSDSLAPRSPTLIALMRAYPLNLLNGHEVLERRGDVERKQSSLLVTIPE